MLSIIIVNYNVKYFLEQCLYAVEKALRQYSREAEILVVDNCSRDGSLEYLGPRFPAVRFIANRENMGFARANNLALAEARGDYILFLNPDTIIAEDSLEKSIALLSAEPAAGAAGVHMIDGSGRFLKESRRGFPSPWVSFCRMSGLTTLFPHSGLFAGYYLGGTDATKNGPAPILSGACMLVKKQVLGRMGGFDERFFMYAEDIDLSYRIGLAGYTNYYIADSTIIHFKGESTRKDVRYVKLFYKAMSQFSHKHFKKGTAAWFTFLMDIAIGCRAAVTALLGLFSRERKRKTPPTGAIPATYITGDPGMATRLKERLAAGVAAGGGGRAGSGGWVIVEDPELAREIVLCEGTAFSFKKIIEEIGKKPGIVYLIHASGSDCIIGSHSGNEKGEVIIL